MVLNDSQPNEWLTQPWPLTWHLTFKVNEQCTGYRAEIASERIPKLYQMIASLPGQLAQPWSLTSYLTFKFKFKVKCQTIVHGCVICPGKLAVVDDHFGSCISVISRCHLVPRLLTLNLIFQVRFKVKRLEDSRDSRSSRLWLRKLPGRLAVTWDHFGRCADVISGRYPIPRPST